MTEHFWSGIVQRKTGCSQAAICRLHSRKTKIDQSDLGIVNLTFVQQILHHVTFTRHAVFLVVIMYCRRYTEKNNIQHGDHIFGQI